MVAPALLHSPFPCSPSLSSCTLRLYCSATSVLPKLCADPVLHGNKTLFHQLYTAHSYHSSWLSLLVPSCWDPPLQACSVPLVPHWLLWERFLSIASYWVPHCAKTKFFGYLYIWNKCLVLSLCLPFWVLCFSVGSFSLFLFLSHRWQCSGIEPGSTKCKHVPPHCIIGPVPGSFSSCPL